MCATEKGQHMVLAERVEINILDYDHLLVVLLEEGGAEYGIGVFVVALSQELHGVTHAVRGAEQSLAFGILTDECDEGGYMFFNSLGLIRIRRKCL